MDMREVVQKTMLGSFLCVDISLVERYPGWVRHTVFHQSNEVVIYFYGYGYDDEGYRFGGRYSSLDRAVNAVEMYIGRPLGEWIDCYWNQYYPEKGVNDGHFSLGELQLMEDIMENRVALPKNGRFRFMSHKPTQEDYSRYREKVLRELSG